MQKKMKIVLVLFCAFSFLTIPSSYSFSESKKVCENVEIKKDCAEITADDYKLAFKKFSTGNVLNCRTICPPRPISTLKTYDTQHVAPQSAGNIQLRETIHLAPSAAAKSADDVEKESILRDLSERGVVPLN